MKSSHIFPKGFILYISQRLVDTTRKWNLINGRELLFSKLASVHNKFGSPTFKMNYWLQPTTLMVNKYTVRSCYIKTWSKMAAPCNKDSTHFFCMELVAWWLEYVNTSIKPWSQTWFELEWHDATRHDTRRHDMTWHWGGFIYNQYYLEIRNSYAVSCSRFR